MQNNLLKAFWIDSWWNVREGIGSAPTLQECQSLKLWFLEFQDNYVSWGFFVLLSKQFLRCLHCQQLGLGCGLGGQSIPHFLLTLLIAGNNADSWFFNLHLEELPVIVTLSCFLTLFPDHVLDLDWFSLLGLGLLRLCCSLNPAFLGKCWVSFTLRRLTPWCLRMCLEDGIFKFLKRVSLIA